MARNAYKCGVCGKTLVIAGPRNIELHEKSAFHIAAMKNQKSVEVVEPVISGKPPEVESTNGIRTTIPEGIHDKRKEDGDSDEWDGYLC